MEPSALSSFFGWADYAVLVLNLVLASAIGIYYACSGSKQSSTKEYILANKSMGTFPIALSLLASNLSAIMLLGNPAEVYFFGSMISWQIPSWIFVITGAVYFYMPVFYGLQVTSAYEYLELRFNRLIRRICCACYIFQTLLYMSIVVYAPALALSQVTGISYYVTILLTIAVCVFYTTLGGIKAVVWTDTLQAIVMYGSFLAVLIKGAYDEGGPGLIWESNKRSGRVDFFQYDINLTTRHTIWNLLFSFPFTMLANYGVGQAYVQRFLAVPSIKTARNALWLNLLGSITVQTTCVLIGFVLSAKYETCDPFTSKLISKQDQILPYFVMDTLSQYSGFPGLFVAGIYSGSLSTVSSSLNSLAAVTLEDFIRPCWPTVSDSTATNLTKGVAVLYGLLTLAFTFAASYVKSIIEANGTIQGVLGGPILAVFTLGMFFPKANSIGAIFGFLAGLGIMLWIGFGALALKVVGQLPVVGKPLSTEGCLFDYGTNVSLPEGIAVSASGHVYGDVLGVYKLSYVWYPAAGFCIVLIVGLTVSLLYKPQDPKKLNPKLTVNTADTLFWFLPANVKELFRVRVGEEYQS